MKIIKEELRFEENLKKRLSKFNIADISIVSGVIVLLYIILLKSTNDNEN